MAKKDVMNKGVSIIPNLGEKQGSWYFPLKFLLTTICAGAIIVIIAAIVDLLDVPTGFKVLLYTLLVIIAVGYVLAIIKLFLDWCKYTKAITDQEVAKSQILFLETYRRARELKPNEALYDETEWVHDLTNNLRKNKSLDEEPKK